MKSNYRLRSINVSNYSELELNAIFDLNQLNTPEVGSLESLDYLKKLIGLSAHNLLVLKCEEIVGFIICMREGSTYGSENYKFFTQRLKKFLYVDRVVVDERHRRSGLGKAIYQDIFAYVNDKNLPIALEVNTEPVNQPSLKFHEKMGFEKVGSKDFDDHSVAYFLK
jgi:predicted GNAT superfamily acetyltransferase